MRSAASTKNMHVLLFIFYSIVLCYALTKIPFFRNSGIRSRVLLFYFGLRVATGCLHNWIAYRYYPNHGDVWTFFTHSFNTRHELFTDFRVFWADNSTLAYLPHNLIEWMHVLFNFFSFDNLYINTLLFSFLALGGIIALFRVFASRFGDDLLSSLCVLLLPSTLFWTTCIHTEGILYPLLGFFLYYLNRLLMSEGPRQPTLSQGPFIRQALLCLFLFILVVFFRPAILVGLLPATLFWILSEKGFFRQPFQRTPQPQANRIFHRRPIPLLLAGATILILLLLIPTVSSRILHTLSTRQLEFQQLTGNSKIYLPVLEPSWGSFGRVLPSALLNGLFQPLPGSGGQHIYAVFSVELLLLWLIIVYSLFRRPHLSSFGITCLLFSFLGMLLIGYIIPFIGSIIRYRSIYLPFLLAPFLHTLRHQRITSNLNKWLKQHLVESLKH